MARLLPSRPDTSAAEQAEPRVIGVDSEDAEDLLSALSSDTARRLLVALHDEPDTPSSLADRLDTSLQNVQYHLEKLSAAEVVDVVDTVYSEKGREMKVYAPADKPLVLFASSERERPGLKTALTRLLGAVGLLGVASLVVQALVGDGFPFVAQSGSAGGGDGGVAIQEASRVTADAAATGPAIPPGLVFFLGGLVVLLSVAVVLYFRR